MSLSPIPLPDDSTNTTAKGHPLPNPLNHPNPLPPHTGRKTNPPLHHPPRLKPTPQRNLPPPPPRRNNHDPRRRHRSRRRSPQHSNIPHPLLPNLLGTTDSRAQPVEKHHPHTHTRYQLPSRKEDHLLHPPPKTLPLFTSNNQRIPPPIPRIKPSPPSLLHANILQPPPHPRRNENKPVPPRRAPITHNLPFSPNFQPRALAPRPHLLRTRTKISSPLRERLTIMSRPGNSMGGNGRCFGEYVCVP